MTTPNKYRALLILVLVAIIAAGSLVAWSRYKRNQPIEISLAPRQALQGQISVDGAVNNPGLYPFKANDSLGAIIRDAGGTASGADTGQFKLYVPRVGEGQTPQKVNLNRAEAWLLAALPGIGEARAQAIIDYRRKNGPFRDTSELTSVEGIGAATYQRIKSLVTVAD